MNRTDLVGNALCLDFANTVNKRPHPDRDALDSFEDISRWAVVAGLVMKAPQGRRVAPAELAAARRLREAIYRVFSAVASGSEPQEADIAPIMRTYASALPAAQLRRDKSRFILHWPPPYALRELTWSVAASAVQLLLRGPVERIGECPSCGWLFLDTSRGGRRRWCSMSVCGARVKARRYYAATTGR